MARVIEPRLLPPRRMLTARGGKPVRLHRLAGGLLVGLGLMVVLRGAAGVARTDRSGVRADPGSSAPPFPAPWAGGAAVVMGAALLLSGTRRTT